MQETKRPAFRLCNDYVLKHLFSEIPNVLILLISDLLNIDYNNIKDNTKVYALRDSHNISYLDLAIKVGDYYLVNIKFNQPLEENNNLKIDFGKFKDDFKDINENFRGLYIKGFRNWNDAVIESTIALDKETLKPIEGETIVHGFSTEKCYNIFYKKEENEDNVSDRIIKWGTILYTTNISEIPNIMGEDFIPKEDKEKFLKVIMQLENKFKKLTDEQISLLDDWHFENRIIASIDHAYRDNYWYELYRVTKILLNEKIDITLISEITGLDKKEIIVIDRLL